jgi:predicted transcriptional regulator of viral defense system
MSEQLGLQYFGNVQSRTYVTIMMTFVPSSREVLYALAVPRSGWITAAEANDAGVSRQQLARYAESGVLRRSRYGIYRFRDLPAQPFEDVIEACLWACPKAAASHETALAIYGLGDAMPASIHLTVPHRLRKKRAGVIVHVAPCATADVETRDGVPITSAVRTIRDIAAISTIQDTASIVREAEESGLLRRREAKELTKELMGSK